MATIKLTQDFKEFLQLLNSAKIDYLLIGGYAVGLYGYVRPTKDMDVWVATTPDNLDRLLQVLIEFGFAPGTIKREDFTTPKAMFRMGVPPNRLEILTSISGVEFADCYSRRVTMDIQGVPTSVISYEDLKRNKSASDRLSDRADVQRLERSKLRGRK